MQSITQHIYPQVVWREGKRMLWNPIYRKPLKNRPEERVRLRVIEYLLLAGWSKHRITTEEAIDNLSDANMRTDIICYSQQFDPLILIECKAEHISITAKTAEQVARYNKNISAPYLLMTNGRTDFWYNVGKTRIKTLDYPPDILESNPDLPPYNFDAWYKRGFAGENASPPLRKWLVEVLPRLWHAPSSGSISFLNFNQKLTDLDLSHYYNVQRVAEKRRLAVSVLRTAYGGSRLVGILNEEDQNKAVLEINLDLVFAGKTPNATVYSHTGAENMDVTPQISFSPEVDSTSLIEQMQEIIAGYTS